MLLAPYTALIEVSRGSYPSTFTSRYSAFCSRMGPLFQYMSCGAVQGVPCSRQEMLKTLNDFVEADMGDVDRYVLKQGSTMVSCT